MIRKQQFVRLAFELFYLDKFLIIIQSNVKNKINGNCEIKIHQTSVFSLIG